MSTKNLFSLILCQGQVSFYTKKQHNWQNKPLNLETFNTINSADDLNLLLEQFNSSLNKENGLNSIELVVLYAADSVQYLTKLSEQLLQLQCTSWQVLYWESLFQRAISIHTPQNRETAHQDETWLVNTLLPLLDNTLNYQDEAWLAERKRAQNEHEESLSSLKADRTRLENQIVLLQQQVKSIRSYDLNQLMPFLPIIYRNFWSKIKPSDLALIAGSLDIPTVLSPYLEPDSHTLMTMKQKLQKLPEENQNQLRDLCAQLPETLEIRPEMRFFFNY